MPWWAPLGGVIGAFAVIAGLLFVDKVGRRLRGPDHHGQHPHVARHRPFWAVWRSAAFARSGPRGRRRTDGRRYLRHFKVLSTAVALRIYTPRRGDIDPAFNGSYRLDVTKVDLLPENWIVQS